MNGKKLVTGFFISALVASVFSSVAKADPFVVSFETKDRKPFAYLPGKNQDQVVIQKDTGLFISEPNFNKKIPFPVLRSVAGKSEEGSELETVTLPSIHGKTLINGATQFSVRDEAKTKPKVTVEAQQADVSGVPAERDGISKVTTRTLE